MKTSKTTSKTIPQLFFLIFSSLFFFGMVACGDSNSSPNNSEMDALYDEIDRAYDATLEANGFPEDPPEVKAKWKACKEGDSNACDWLAKYHKTTTRRIEKAIEEMKRWD